MLPARMYIDNIFILENNLCDVLKAYLAYSILPKSGLFQKNIILDNLSNSDSSVFKNLSNYNKYSLNHKSGPTLGFLMFVYLDFFSVEDNLRSFR